MSTMPDLAAGYESFYRERDPVHVYPVEFVVRAFLAEYPRLPRASLAPGARVLDLGFGDGRNMPLLHQLGLVVSGVEISADICARTSERMRRLGVPIDARVGRNREIPFETAWFDHILACHSCYYIDRGTTFADNVREIARVTKPGGRLVCSVPIGTSYIFRGASDLGGGHMEITSDPYGIRNGSILRKFDREQEIEAALNGAFTDFHIGSCRSDFWGIEEDVWIVVCHRGA